MKRHSHLIYRNRPFIQKAEALAVSLVLMCTVLANPLTSRAQGVNFVVDSTGDQDDANLGDGLCKTAANTCTLRAAIEQANSSTNGVEIMFNVGIATIKPSTNLPPITANKIIINGGGHITLEGTTVPAAGSSGLFLLQSSGSKIQGLTIKGFSTGISIAPSNGATKFNPGGGDIIGTDGDGQNDAAEGNVIIDNGTGVLITNTPGNTIAGNRIGTDTTGTMAMPNGTGISIVGGYNNRIGTNGDGVSDALEANIISGNKGQGVELNGSGLDKIEGNLIGVTASGNAALGNGEYGILLIGQASENLIGTDGNSVSNGAERNVISANGYGGIGISDGFKNFIAGNIIGLNAAGNAALGNGGDGIELLGSSNVGTTSSPSQWQQHNTIGYFGSGDVNAERNIIGGNTGNGISILNSSFDTIAGNSIGTDATGTLNLGNKGQGIYLAMTFNFFTSATTDDLIGGISSQEANIIAFNGLNGVAVGHLTPTSAQPDRIAILSNSIFSNGLLGIDLVNDSTFGIVTPNVPGGAGVGANGLLNFPVLTSVTRAGNSVTIQGSMLNFLPLTPVKIQFFANQTCNASGYGEGQVFLGELNLTADLSGNIANFSSNFTNVPLTDNIFTATATQVDPAGGSTSEFSQCIATSFMMHRVHLFSPSGSTNSANPAFIWQPLIGALRYELILKPPKGRPVDVWFDAAKVCGKATCTVQLNTPLVEGKYDWRMVASTSEGKTPPGEPLFFTVKLTPELLHLSESCSSDPAAFTIWQVTNVSADTVVFTWKVDQTPLIGTDFVAGTTNGAPGQTVFPVPTTFLPQTVRIFVNGVQQDMKQGMPLACGLATPQSAPTYVPPEN